MFCDDLYLDMYSFSAKSPEEKKRSLYLEELRVLDSFLEWGAISREQYFRSVTPVLDRMNLLSAKKEVPAGH